MKHVDETIFALSSGSPPAAIAVIRISGTAARHALEALAGRVPAARRASYAVLRDPGSGELLDRALILWFPGPNTATGEDLAELHLHGGRAVVAGVAAALGRMESLRAAEPGEFTRRAFMNGRIDLAEAEGLGDLLSSETRSQRLAALQLVGGALSRQVEEWQETLLRIAANVEALLDFSDEDDVTADVGASIAEAVSNLSDRISAMLFRPPAERLRDGIIVVLAGPVNAGKSSLINALSQREVAITSDIPGTTRDLVEAPVSFSGVPFRLVDTAGLRDSSDRIESIGVDKAKRALDQADIVLWLGSAGESPGRCEVITVATKSDIVGPDRWADVSVSAVTGQGLDALVALLVKRGSSILPAEGEVALNARHRALLADCVQNLEMAKHENDLLIVAEHLRLARVGFDAVTGRAGVENMLDALFGRFCIGK